LLLDEGGGLSAVARLVAHAGNEITLLNAAAGVLIEEHLVLVEDAGGVDLGRAVAGELSLAVDHDVLAAAVQDAAVGLSEALAHC
jgi:hypothetical protein